MGEQGKIKVIFLTEHIPKYREPFFNALAKDDRIELKIITADDPFLSEYMMSNSGDSRFNVVRLPVVRFLFDKASLTCKLIFLKGLIGTIKELKPDVVIISSNLRWLQNYSIFALRGTGHFKIIVWTPGTAEHFGILSRMLSPYSHKSFCNKYIDGFLVYTNIGRRCMEGKDLPKDKIFVFNNTIDIDNNRKIYNALNEREISRILGGFGISSFKNIVFLGRMIKEKDPNMVLDYFNEIVKRTSDIQCIIIGEGHLLNELKKNASDKIIFTGAIFDEKVIAAIIKSAKLIISARRVGLNINHAFSYGKPLVTFRGYDHSPEIEYLEDGKNGLLLDPNNFEKNVAEIISLLTDEERYNKMAKAAWETASSLTIYEMAKKVAEAVITVFRG